MKKIPLCIFLILIFSFPLVQAQNSPHPFSVQDLVIMQRISDPQTTHLMANRSLLFLYTSDLEANRGRRGYLDDQWRWLTSAPS